MKDIIYKNIQVTENKIDDTYVVEVRKINEHTIYKYLFKDKKNKSELFEIAKKHIND